MRRLTCRVIVITIGLVLGWSAGGYVSQGMAGDVPTGHEMSETAHGGEGDHGQVAATAAKLLIPTADQLGWFPPVRTGVVVLFALAVLLGIPALVLKAPDPPDPAAQHHH